MKGWKSVCVPLAIILALEVGLSAVAPAGATGGRQQRVESYKAVQGFTVPFATPTPTVIVTPSSWVYLPLTLKDFVAPEAPTPTVTPTATSTPTTTPTPLPLNPPPPIGTVEAGGMAVIDVVNDTPYTLTLEFDGPSQTTTVLERCAVCRVYHFIGPIFCPTEDRPRTEIQLIPGAYWVRASVDDPDIGDYAGQWPLEENTKYFECFYILVTWGSNGLTVHPMPGCPVERQD